MRECERKLCVAFHVPEQRDGTRSLRFRPGMRRGSSFVRWVSPQQKCFELELVSGRPQCH